MRYYKTILAILIATIITGCATPPLLPEHTYKKYESQSSLDKGELWTKANEFMIETFVNAESVIQHKDKEEGIIIGKYHQDYMFGIAFVTTIKLKIKDKIAVLEFKNPTNTVDGKVIDSGVFGEFILEKWEAIGEQFKRDVK